MHSFPFCGGRESPCPRSRESNRDCCLKTGEPHRLCATRRLRPVAQPEQSMEIQTYHLFRDSEALPFDSSPEAPEVAPRAEQQAGSRGKGLHTGVLIINGDDWGRDKETTDRMFDCVLYGTVSSVSAMVLMEDSERAATVARERGIDAGLHLNFTTSFSARNCSGRLVERQQEI